MTAGITIHPTLHCFNDAVDFIEHVVEGGELARARDLILVHAIVIMPDGPEAGAPFVHAWVEEPTADGVLCWQGGMLDGQRVFFSVDAGAYLGQMRPQHLTRYTMREVLDENRRSGHVGPWRAEYQRLCRTEGDR